VARPPRRLALVANMAQAAYFCRYDFVACIAVREGY
jgi:hypothetical protein